MGLPANQVAWVPSNGAAPAMQDLAAGGLDLTTCSVPEARAIIEAGKARSLAIMAPARNPVFPNVPTLKEAMGIDYSTGAWRGIAGPKGLPADVATKLTASLKKVYDSKEYKDFMSNRGFGVVWGDGGPIRDLHGQGRRPDGRGDEGRRSLQGLIRPACSLPRISVGPGSCVFPIASRDRFSLSSAQPPPMAAGCCRRCPASRSVPTYSRW